MPSEEEVISLLRKARANEPGRFTEYMEFYKKNHPDFYKNKIAPEFETAEEKKTRERAEIRAPNPADQLGSESPPLGSANVGEEIITENKPETSTKPIIKKNESTIQRKKFPWKKVLIITGVILGLGVIGVIVYFFVLAP